LLLQTTAEVQRYIFFAAVFHYFIAVLAVVVVVVAAAAAATILHASLVTLRQFQSTLKTILFYSTYGT